MKKSLILPILVAVLATSALSACKKDPVPTVGGNGGTGVYHDHKYDGYKVEGDKHYQICTYMNCDYETEKVAHTYDQKVATPDTFVSVATCDSAAKFYASCVCGVVSDSVTFEYGEKLTHNGSGEFVSDATSHWKVCDCGEQHLKEAHDLLAIHNEVATCEEAGGHYNLCSQCGWETPISEREDYVAPLGHQYVDAFTVSTIPYAASEGRLSLACNREGCDTLSFVTLPEATAENYTITQNATETTLKLKPEVITALAKENTKISNLATRLGNTTLKVESSKVGYPFEFRINNKQVLPEVPEDTDYDLNKTSIIIKLEVGDQLTVREGGVLVNFKAESGTLFSGPSYTSTEAKVLKLFLSKNGGIYSEVLNVLPYEEYSLKVDGVEVEDAFMTPSGTDFAQFSVELEKDQVVTFFGDGNALKGGIVADATLGYTALSSGVHTFYVNNRNEIYVTAPKLETAVEITYYYYNSLEWTTVNCYSWATMGTTNHELTGGWPGKAMSPVEGREGWFSITTELTDAVEQVNVIFTDGTDANKTADIPVLTDIENVKEGYYFFGKSVTSYETFDAAQEASGSYVAPVWGLCGNFNGWGGDIPMVKNSNGDYEAILTYNKDIEFKVRKEGSWTINYGGTLANGQLTGEASSQSNIKVPAGTYKVTFNETTLLITVTPVNE